MNCRVLVALSVLLFVGSLPVSAQNQQLNVIANSQSVPGEMNIDQLRTILRGERLRWDDGVSVKIALMKTNTTIGSYTCERIYNMSTNELNKYFLAQVFQGKVKAPTFFTSKSELEDFVARTPGAIGVSQNTTLSGSEIKLVVIDGKKQL
ncbi:hypothetical protein G3570_06615 [Balneolaceae bacterium YR4-1]|uniref:PBP superfamily domain-containing protein n=1 Tax=Halalkalibaculum roseum TaxID=2709311 RepID=A0A6M1T0L6_9BACT|nr:hypothetical protein [Halalkalibaculum roseum]NGP76297.1 hypothetical protein [Halalkalibaculum roseum]